MTIRLLTTAAVLGLIAAPAFADCGQEIKNLEQAMIGAPTGGEMPATPHQQAVTGNSEAGTAQADAGTGAAADAASPHQEEVLAGTEESTEAAAPQASTGGGDLAAATTPHQDGVIAQSDAVSAEVGGLIEHARALEASGDEQGCMGIAAQAQQMMDAK